MQYEIIECCSTALGIPASYCPLPRSHPNRLSFHPYFQKDHVLSQLSQFIIYCHFCISHNTTYEAEMLLNSFILKEKKNAVFVTYHS